jgi:hypothetical protein
MSKKGDFASLEIALRACAKRFSQWFRQRPQREIIVVSHGECLRYITDGWSEWDERRNAKVKVCEFDDIITPGRVLWEHARLI